MPKPLGRTLTDFALLPRWVAWRTQWRETKEGGWKPTKVPIDPQTGRKAQIPTNPFTWGTRQEAERRWRQLDDGNPGGVGIVLGELDEGTLLMGIDLDDWLDAQGHVEPWANEVLDRFDTYAEISPSGAGVKLFFRIAANDIDTVIHLMAKHSKGPVSKGTRVAFTAGEHREIALDRARYYAVTDKIVEAVPATIRVVGIDHVRWFLERAGPNYLARHGRGAKGGAASQVGGHGRDESGSGCGFRFMRDRRRGGMSYTQAKQEIRLDGGKAGEWARRSDERQLQRAWDNAPNDATRGDGELEMQRVSDVKMQSVEWLWPSRLAFRKLTIIGGDPGLGKSTILADITARITTEAARWPDRQPAPTGSVVLLSAEDAIDDTLAPRIVAARGDPAYVRAVKMVKEKDGRRRLFNLRLDLDKLKAKIERLRKDGEDVLLVGVDPISAYLGDDIDSHKMTAVNAVLGQVVAFAEEADVAVVAVHHPPKEAPRKAIHAFSGSLAFSAAPRFVFVVVEDELIEGRKLLLPVKTTVSAPPRGLGYRIVKEYVEIDADHNIETSRIEWDDQPVDVTANEALRAANSAGTKRERAMEFLREQLADGPVLQSKLVARAKAADISESTLERAKRRLGVASRPTGFGGPHEWMMK